MCASVCLQVSLAHDPSHRELLIRKFVVFAEAKALISGPSDLYVKRGSAVSISCVISQGPHDLGTVFWYRGAAILQPQQHGERLRIDMDWTEALTSRLYIADARPVDSGNYTCVPTVAEPASVTVHVINGKHSPSPQRHPRIYYSIIISSPKNTERYRV